MDDSFAVFWGSLWSLFIIGLIVFFIWRRTKSGAPLKDGYRRFTLSKEDSVSQSLLLLSVLFLGATLLALNRDLGDPISWRAIFLVTSAAGLASAYYFKAVYLLTYGLIGAVSWWGIQAERWITGKGMRGGTLLAGLAWLALISLVLGHLHGEKPKFKRFSLIYLGLGLFFITGLLFFLSTRAGLEALEELTRGNPILRSWEVLLSLLLFGASLTGLTLYAGSKKIVSRFEAWAVILLALLFGLVAFLPQQRLFLRSGFSTGRELSGSGILWALLFNLVIFLELIGVIFSGYWRKEEWVINLGALLLFLLITVKYFDWFFTFLDKGIAFIGAGILLFVVGWLMEKGRRYMISNVKAGP